MQVQFHTDNHVQGADSLAEWAERTLRDRLDRFGDDITRIEVHVSDADGTRANGQGKRCLLEARLAGRQPLAVSHEAANVADAMFGAADKLARAIETALGRSRDARLRDSIRGAEQP